MIEPHELPWDSLTPAETAKLFAGWDRFWCIAGGWSIDLHVGHQSREHGDVDVLVLRRDLDALHHQLPGWELWVAWPPGTLIPWRKGESIPEKAHDIWCRPTGTERWQFQLMVMEHDSERWIYRRNRSIGGPLDSLRTVVDGIPVIAPEVQLLFKSNRIRPKDEADFQSILPILTSRQRLWLRSVLAAQSATHPWLAVMESSSL